jgi:hypothetical protein
MDQTVFQICFNLGGLEVGLLLLLQALQIKKHAAALSNNKDKTNLDLPFPHGMKPHFHTYVKNYDQR